MRLSWRSGELAKYHLDMHRDGASQFDGGDRVVMRLYVEILRTWVPVPNSEPIILGALTLDQTLVLCISQYLKRFDLHVSILVESEESRRFATNFETRVFWGGNQRLTCKALYWVRACWCR